MDILDDVHHECSAHSEVVQVVAPRCWRVITHHQYFSASEHIREWVTVAPLSTSAACRMHVAEILRDVLLCIEEAPVLEPYQHLLHFQKAVTDRYLFRL